jgi:hypothetical protein
LLAELHVRFCSTGVVLQELQMRLQMHVSEHLAPMIRWKTARAHHESLGLFSGGVFLAGGLFVAPPLRPGFPLLRLDSSPSSPCGTAHSDCATSAAAAVIVVVVVAAAFFVGTFGNFFDVHDVFRQTIDGVMHLAAGAASVQIYH